MRKWAHWPPLLLVLISGRQADRSRMQLARQAHRVVVQVVVRAVEVYTERCVETGE